jgi:hypothetical protein
MINLIVRDALKRCEGYWSREYHGVVREEKIVDVRIYVYSLSTLKLWDLDTSWIYMLLLELAAKRMSHV